ncbi:MAG: ROK family protein [Fusobacterium sp. JB021]|nr:ROK family protein [Fusobacterium sp. JB021]
MNIKLDSLKIINTGIILSTIKKNNFTRVELQKNTHLAAGTTSNIIKELVSKDIIIEKIENSKTRGRNGKKLHINSKYKYIIGIKVRRGTVLASLNDLAGNEIVSLRETLIDKSVNSVVDTIVKVCFLLKENYPILGIGIAFPGQVNSNYGIINYSTFYQWENINLKEILESKIDFCDIFIENDVRAMALTEKEFLDPEIKNMIYLHLGHGISTGIIINNSLLLGDNFIAGQIGHTYIKDNHIECKCGKVGCLETLASNPSLLEFYKEKSNIKSHIDFNFFLNKIKEKDEFALEIFNAATSYIATSLGNLLNILNISTIVIGGDLTNLNDFFFDNLASKIKIYALPHVSDNMNLIKSKYNHSENTIGAVYIILDKFYSGELI